MIGSFTVIDMDQNVMPGNSLKICVPISEELILNVCFIILCSGENICYLFLYTTDKLRNYPLIYHPKHYF